MNEGANMALKELSLQDALTKVANRRFFDAILTIRWRSHIGMPGRWPSFYATWTRSRHITITMGISGGVAVLLRQSNITAAHLIEAADHTRAPGPKSDGHSADGKRVGKLKAPRPPDAVQYPHPVMATRKPA